jgi:predicted  nucleic acid-binding Zn-ribbon protein
VPVRSDFFRWWGIPGQSFRKDAQVVRTLDEYKSPPRKIIAMLHEGRDRLRRKYADLKRNLRTAENQVRAVEKSRAVWRQRAEAAEKGLADLKKGLPTQPPPG